MERMRAAWPSLNFKCEHWAFARLVLTLAHVVRMKAVVHVAGEVGWSVKPRASADEEAPRKPFRTIVTVGRAVIRCGVIVSIWAVRSDTNVHADLSLHFGSDRAWLGYCLGCSGTEGG